MSCEKPRMRNGFPIACGRCLPCTIAHRRLWTHRLMLESMCHATSSFLTLTYSDEHLPRDASLNPEHTRLWLMRFRSALIDYSSRQGIAPIRIRYYLVGEYGDQSQRPHYHAALFGVGPEFAQIVSSTWNMGHIYLAEFNLHTAQYICGYVTKKLTSKDDTRLARIDEHGHTYYLHPEFSRMSRRPGIGVPAMDMVLEALQTEHGINEMLSLNDVPCTLQFGGRKFPLGRFLRSKLRQMLGIYFVDPKTGEVKYDTPRENLTLYREELLVMLKTAINDTKIDKEATLSPAHLSQHKNKGLVASIKSKHKIFNQRNKI